MEVCEDCFYYDKSETYVDTGYCKMWSEYVDTDDSCPEFDEGW